MALASLFLSSAAMAQTETVGHNLSFSSAPKDSAGNGYISMLSSNTTVYFTNTQTAAQMQGVIDGFPRNLGGYTLTFQLYGCKYTNSSALYFANFRNGALSVLGVAVVGPSASQTTIVTNSAGGNVFVFQGGDSSLSWGIDSVRCETAGPSYGVAFLNCAGFNAMGNCYVWIGGNTGAGMVATSSSRVLVYQSGFGGGGSGIYVNGGARVITSNNSSLALPTPPTWGHYVDLGSTLQRYDDLTIQSGADNYVSQGGLLITGAGVQIP